MGIRLLCKVGAYAGQVVEYPFHVAENLLQNGLAERLPDGEGLGPRLETASQPTRETPEWPGKMPPEVYLRRYPTGKHADLAKEIVGS